MPLEPTTVRGHFIPVLRDLERAQVSPERWEAFLATLAVDCPWRQLPDPQAWVPLSAIHACNQAFVEWSGIEDRRVRGEVLAEAMFGSLPPDPGRTPEAFIRALPAFWEANAQHLHMTVESLLPGEALVRVEAAPPDPEWFPRTAAAWLRRALALHGGQEVTLESHPVEDGNRYRLRWKDAPARG